MVGHNQRAIANFSVDVEAFKKIHIAIIREGFYKVISATPDISEVNIEYLLTRTEPSDDIIYLTRRVFQTLRDGSLAEIYAVIARWTYLYEAL